MIIERRMTRNPITCNPEMSLADAASLMKHEKVSRLPVLDKNKKLIGLITEKDILYASPSPATSLSIHEMAYLLSRLTVGKLMKKDVVTIEKNTTVEESARLMVDQDISCLPVVENGVLVGILTKTDMFKILLELFGARHFGVRVSYIVEDKPGTIAHITAALEKKGIDIITFGTFMGTDPTNSILTMKVQGASMTEVIEIIKPFVSQILDVQEV
ncbi:MAG: CBS domain-containing protein [Sphaerochaeta sp.]